MFKSMHKTALVNFVYFFLVIISKINSPQLVNNNFWRDTICFLTIRNVDVVEFFCLFAIHSHGDAMITAHAILLYTLYPERSLSSKEKYEKCVNTPNEQYIKKRCILEVI